MSEKLQSTAIIVLLLCVISMCLYGVHKLNQTIDRQQLKEVDYILNIVDDSLVIYHYDGEYVGTVKSEGQLDSLLIDDNL